MIQDIAPHRYDNSYRPRQPEEGDYVLAIRNGRSLLRRQEGGEEYGIPTLEELERAFPGGTGRTHYLFAIDERPYFLAEPEEGWGPDAQQEGDFAWKGTEYYRTMTPMFQAFAAVTATQLWRWRRDRRFCGRCGALNRDSDKERALVCPHCGQTEYPKICPAIIVAVTNGDKLLMTRYRGRTYGGYALIAGFVEIGETFEETVRREVMEEVGLKVRHIRYYHSQPWAFTDTEMIGFFAELDGDDTIRLQEEELAQAGWYTRAEIPHEDIRISVGSEMKMAFKYRTFPC